MFVPKSSNTTTTSPSVDSTALRVKQLEIGRWVQQLLQVRFPLLAYQRDYQMMVTEVQCNDPSCVPVETLVAIILNEDPELLNVISPSKFSTKILKPILEVNEADLEEIEWPFILSDPTLQSFTVQLKKLISSSLIDGGSSDRTKDRRKGYIANILSNVASAATLQLIKEEEQRERDKMEAEKRTKEEAERKRKIQEANENITVVKMTNTSTISQTSYNPTTATAQIPSLPSSSSTKPTSKVGPALTVIKGGDEGGKPRHEKGSRRRGCPCCDPDNLDNKIDKMMFLDIPPN
eukprot:gene7968-8612_t